MCLPRFLPSHVRLQQPEGQGLAMPHSESRLMLATGTGIIIIRTHRAPFEMDETGQNVQIFEEVLFFEATYNIYVRSLKKRTSSKLCTFCPVSSNKKAFF